MIYQMVAMIVFLTSEQAICGDHQDKITAITKTHLKGDLDEAITLIEEALNCPDLPTHQAIDYHLILATIYDRKGLHNHSRPHPETLRNIELAVSRLEGSESRSHAQVNLSYAEFYYRAEMQNRKFTKASEYALAAIAGFEKVDDLFGQSDAVHALGLIHLQRNELDEARKYFDRSLALEELTLAPRARILADYERHIGFIESRSDHKEEALIHFQKSFEIRRDSGIDDAALFAGQTLASTLLELGKTKEALAPISYSVRVSERIQSHYGKMISYYVLGLVTEQLGDTSEAKRAFEKTLMAAEVLGHKNGAKNASSGLERLRNK